MHHQAVKSNLGSRAYEYDDDQPLCPKPRRLPPSIPEFLKPLTCIKHSQTNADEESRVLNMITEKNYLYGKELVCNGCLPCCYSGSPPRRTENPLIHDVEFLHQIELLSPFSHTKLSHNFAFTSPSPI
ncbi:uncharacterized protein G2W53_036362 [Senna tora]|uniref:Uncharacterized protein n=1 Tax=Senna tora TaxID=362788 RepID=A0A834STC8_9FABA|nr:uncharacterized protein G2W53_036362 [Senna tora]